MELDGMRRDFEQPRRLLVGHAVAESAQDLEFARGQQARRFLRQRVETSRFFRSRTYCQSRCDGAKRGIDLSRACVGREPAGKLSANGADRDGWSRQNG